MAKTLNFNTMQKKYMTVTLPGKKSAIMIGTPTKSMLKRLTDLNVDQDVDIEGMKNDMDILDELYDVCSKIMSKNKGGVTVTADFLSEELSLEEVIIFLREYMIFVRESINVKN